MVIAAVFQIARQRVIDQLIQRDFFKDIGLNQMQQDLRCHWQMILLNRNQKLQIDAHGLPDLSLNCIH